MSIQSDYLSPIGGLAQTGLVGTAATAAATSGAQVKAVLNATTALETARAGIADDVLRGLTDAAKATAQETFQKAETAHKAASNVLSKSWSSSIACWFAKPFEFLGSWGETLTKYSTELAKKAGPDTIKGIANQVGSTAAKWGSKTLEYLAKVPKLPFIGGAIEAVIQIPQVFQGFGEGRGGAAIGNAGTRVAATAASGWAGFKAGALLGTAIGGPIGTVVGGAAGIAIGVAGSWLGGKVADGFWGTNKGNAAATASSSFGSQATQSSQLSNKELRELAMLASMDPYGMDSGMFG